MFYRYTAPIWIALLTMLRSEAIWLGEVFEESSFGRPSPQQTVKKISSDEHRDSYQIDYHGRTQTTFISVAKATRKIYEISFHRKVRDIYGAVAVASTICEGTVSLPTRYKLPDGFYLPCEPGKRYAGKEVVMHAEIVTHGEEDTWTLTARCEDFLWEAAAVEARIKRGPPRKEAQRD